jgi:putative redox protein
MQTTIDPQAPVLTATHAGGMCFAAEVRGHRIETDQPVYGGGADGAAMPLELLGASLGTCVALYVHQFLVSRSLATEGLRVEVTTEMAQKPKRIGAFDVRVQLPAGVPEEYRERVERVAASCPAHATLRHAPEIRFAFEHTVLAAAG